MIPNEPRQDYASDMDGPIDTIIGESLYWYRVSLASRFMTYHIGCICHTARWVGAVVAKAAQW